MMEKYTPGPWKYNKARFEIVSETAWMFPPDEHDTAGLHTTIVSLIGAMGGEDTEADARLIAAAPELLEALEALLSWTGPLQAAAAQAAIAKAKGDQKP